MQSYCGWTRGLRRQGQAAGSAAVAQQENTLCSVSKRRLFLLTAFVSLPYYAVMENLELREAKPSDSQFVLQVRKQAFGKYVEQVWGWNEEEQRKLHQKRFASQQFYIIQWSGIDVGIVAVKRERDILTVNQLLILPEYQGKGIGRACMIRIMNDATTTQSSVKLRVLKINSRAQTFFERLGFERIGESDTHIQMQRPGTRNYH